MIIPVTKSHQSIRSELEVNEQNVPIEGSDAEVVYVQVLHHLPQVGVEDVGEEGVEHLSYSGEDKKIIFNPIFNPHFLSTIMLKAGKRCGYLFLG